MSEYTQGICQDGAAILKDGKMLTIEEILDELRQKDNLQFDYDELQCTLEAERNTAIAFEKECSRLQKVCNDLQNEPDLIEKIVNRFLSWKLPDDFSPDCGITFKREFNSEYMSSIGKSPMINEPVGTNLLNAEQAEDMVRHILGNDYIKMKQQLDGYKDKYNELYNALNRIKHLVNKTADEAITKTRG